MLSSPKYGIFGHWLSEVNTLELKNVHTHLVFIRKLSIPKKIFQRNLKILTHDFGGLQIYLRPGKVPFATVSNIRLSRQMSDNICFVLFCFVVLCCVVLVV